MTIKASEQFHGPSKRVTITLPEDLEAAIKADIGERAFSAYITEAAARLYQQERLTELLDELDAEHGPVSSDVQREVASWWPDAGETA